MDYVLGIDQGGSKTLAVIADLQGRLLGKGQAAGGSHILTGLRHSMTQVESAASQAMEQAGISLSQVRAVGAGMTGADFDHEYDLIRDALGTLFPQIPVTIENDCIIALRAGSENPNAAILCAGTGLNCAVRREDGKKFIFGYYIEDYWQGGSALGKQAMSKVFEADIGITPPTRLTATMLSHFGAVSVPELMQKWVYGQLPLEKINNFAAIIDCCASEGDEVSIGLLTGFGKACARYASAGIRKLGIGGAPLDMVLSGSIFKSKTRLLRDVIEAGIHKACPQAVVKEARYEPVVGGVLLALDTLGETVARELMETSAKNLRLLRL